MKLFAYEGAWQIDRILIVGVGGTGSALAQIAARILWQRGQLGQSVPLLHLVDGDKVEEKNVGRQHFLPLDVGNYKAEITARRLSLLYGLPVIWSNEMYDPDKHLQQGTILVGCVDNHEARRAIVTQSEGTTVLECGNARTHGQVVLSNSGSLEKVLSTIQAMESDQQYTKNGLYYPCRYLPNISLLYPELLEPEPRIETAPEPELSCSELLMLGEQHLLVNDMVAMACGQYLYKLINQEPVTSFVTEVDLHNLTVISKPICPEALKAALNLQLAAAA